MLSFVAPPANGPGCWSGNASTGRASPRAGATTTPGCLLPATLQAHGHEQAQARDSLSQQDVVQSWRPAQKARKVSSLPAGGVEVMEDRLIEAQPDGRPSDVPLAVETVVGRVGVDRRRVFPRHDALDSGQLQG